MHESFTLIELIVVIAIIAILAAIIAPNAFKAIEKAKISKTIGDFKTIKTATMTFYADVGAWPVTDISATDQDTNNITVEGENFISGQNQPAGWDGPYLETWPKNSFIEQKPKPPYFVDNLYQYPNYVYFGSYPLVPHPFVGIGQGVVYLQALICPTAVGQKIKQTIDGTDNFGNDDGEGYGDEPGSVRWHLSTRSLFYIIQNNVGLPPA